MNRCPGCPTVPIVSRQLAATVLARVQEEQRRPALMASLEWLTTRHEGLSLYEGIHGRPYTNAEKDVIALEVGVVEGLPCPLLQGEGCMIGGLGPSYNRVEETAKAPYGWLPTLIATLWDRSNYRNLIKAKAIADAKVSLLTRNEEIGLNAALASSKNKR